MTAIIVYALTDKLNIKISQSSPSGFLRRVQYPSLPITPWSILS